MRGVMQYARGLPHHHSILNVESVDDGLKKAALLLRSKGARAVRNTQSVCYKSVVLSCSCGSSKNRYDVGSILLQRHAEGSTSGTCFTILHVIAFGVFNATDEELQRRVCRCR